jgi:hypothetical protein
MFNPANPGLELFACCEAKLNELVALVEPTAVEAAVLAAEERVEFVEVEFDNLSNENCLFANVTFVAFEAAALSFAMVRAVSFATAPGSGLSIEFPKLVETLGVGNFITLTFPRIFGAPVPLPFMLLPLSVVTFLLGEDIGTLDVAFANAILDCNGIIRVITDKSIMINVTNLTFSKKLLLLLFVAKIYQLHMQAI